MMPLARAQAAADSPDWQWPGSLVLRLVLVAMLGVGVAEQSGFINTGLKKLLKVTPARFLTPMLILVAIVSHTAASSSMRRAVIRWRA